MKKVLIVTSISTPNKGLRALAQGCKENGITFILIGDVASPADFYLQDCLFFGVESQLATEFSLARKCPQRHYARKNIGYLLAAREGADVIIETDDDNLPFPSFWQERIQQQKVALVEESGWVNIYRYFSDQNIWPRGFALSHLRDPLPDYTFLRKEMIDAPIQQGLADDNPDVDAIYRLILPLPQSFQPNVRIAVGPKTWCPFNSQNTAWFRDAFPLLYLPAFCSFRMTDIWRSFVAQRICWENNWHILFHSPTMHQERNKHDLMRDFDDEIDGYRNNEAICEALQHLSLQPGREHIGDNLRKCYQLLVVQKWMDQQELELLDAWLDDLTWSVA